VEERFKSDKLCWETRVSMKWIFLSNSNWYALMEGDWWLGDEVVKVKKGMTLSNKMLLF